MNEAKIRNQVLKSDDYPFSLGDLIGTLLGLGILAQILEQLFNI